MYATVLDEKPLNPTCHMIKPDRFQSAHRLAEPYYVMLVPNIEGAGVANPAAEWRVRAWQSFAEQFDPLPYSTFGMS